MKKNKIDYNKVGEDIINDLNDDDMRNDSNYRYSWITINKDIIRIIFCSYHGKKIGGGFYSESHINYGYNKFLPILKNKLSKLKKTYDFTYRIEHFIDYQKISGYHSSIIVNVKLKK